MLEEQTKLWNQVYNQTNQMMYPDERVVQMFKGDYPYCSLYRGGIQASLFWI